MRYLMYSSPKILARYALVALLLSGANASWAFDALQPQELHKKTSIELINQLRLNHYRYVNIDNAFSKRIFDKYIERIDSTRSYFLEADIAEFEQYRFALDNAINKGNLDAPFTIFNRYQQRANERLVWLTQQLESGIEFDFTVDEYLETDREEADWAAMPTELDELWRKRLKSSVLGLKIAGKTVEEANETLIKRYNNQLSRLHQTNSDDAFQTYMNVVSQSYDPHTEYFAPRRSENFNINMSLSLEGIGAVLQAEEEFTKVVRLVPGGPADLAGELKSLDRIIGVAQGAEGEMVDVVGWRLDDVVELIRGPKESRVRLQIIPRDSEGTDSSHKITIVRNKVLLENQAAKKEILELGDSNAGSKVGIITIPTFYADFAAYQAGDPDYKSTTRDVTKLLHELVEEGVDGVIIDLRNNGGGSLNEANALTGLFIKTGATVQVSDGRGRAKVLKDSDPGIVYAGPLAVMVNRLSASASEIFAGAIQDYQRGLIIGSQTFGKGTVQTILPLEYGQLKITQAKFYRISGESTQNKGIYPDVLLPPVIDITKIGEDVLDDSLPWDSIRPVLHKKSGSISIHVPELTARHSKRVKTNPDYQLRVAEIERLMEIRGRTAIPLSEAQRLLDKAEAEQIELSLENTRRSAKGQPAFETIESLREEEGGNEDDSEEGSIDIATDDPYLLEGAHILVDLIDRSANRVTIN